MADFRSAVGTTITQHQTLMADRMLSVQNAEKSLPKISVITPNRNGERYLRETIESVLTQNYPNFEHIIVDGCSTDGSIEILKTYPHLRWISEPDKSVNDGLRKGLAMAHGDYVMIMCVSDKYLSRSWFRACIEQLESDREISLVWGSAVEMDEAGNIHWLWYPHFMDGLLPEKREFLPLWLATGIVFPELNYCVRREVYLANFPDETPSDIISIYDPLMGFIFNFHVNGYLASFLPIIAHCGRCHAGQHGQQWAPKINQAKAVYRRKMTDYQNALWWGKTRHTFRDGAGRPIGQLSRLAALLLPMRVLLHKLYFPINQVVRFGLLKGLLRRRLARAARQ